MFCSSILNGQRKDRDVMGVGEGAKEPRSMSTGVLPSSAIMILPICSAFKPQLCVFKGLTRFYVPMRVGSGLSLFNPFLTFGDLSDH